MTLQAFAPPSGKVHSSGIPAGSTSSTSPSSRGFSPFPSSSSSPSASPGSALTSPVSSDLLDGILSIVSRSRRVNSPLLRATIDSAGCKSLLVMVRASPPPR
ncbi:hypothetical protein JCM8115_002167 [Rhodotorula mucilaginosa]